jgi:hypothetical protein
MDDIIMEDITKESEDLKAKDSSPSSIDAFLPEEEISWLTSPPLFPTDLDASTEAPTMRTRTPSPSIMDGSLVPSTPRPVALLEDMGRSLAASVETMSLSNSIGTFSVTHVPSNSSGDLRSTFSVKTPLYPSSICQYSPATTLSSLQSTPSTLPSLNNTPTLQQIQSNGAMFSSSGTSNAPPSDRRPLLRSGKIFIDVELTPPDEKVLLLHQEQVSEWDIVVNPNGHVNGINEGSQRFLASSKESSKHH